MTHITCRIVFCVTLSLPALTVEPVQAQADKPRLMLNTGGPVGGIRALAFSSDSSQLYAAGSGKIVNRWEVDGRGDAARAIPADPLRWEIARGLRGRIYTLDVAPATGALAVGGFSARESTGDLAVFDPGRQRIQYLLPRSRPDVPGPGPQPGHTQTVGSIDFSPSGKQMASMSIDGEVRLWTNQGADSVILHPAGRVTDGRIQTVAFLSENRLVFPQQDRQQPAAWRLAIVDPAVPNRPPTQIGQPVYWYGVADIAVSPDGRQAAACDHLGEVTLLANDNTLTPRPLNRPRPQRNKVYKKTVSSLAFGPQGLLAITTASDLNGDCWLELWDTTANPPRQISELELGHGDAAYASAFSPDGRLLAVARADRSSVLLIPVRPGATPLDVNRAVELTGRGREPGVATFVGPEGHRIAVSSPNDPNRLQFDLQTLEKIDGPIPTESRPQAASGWRLVPATRTTPARQELQLFAPGATGPTCSVVLETAHQGDYLSHTWLTDEQGQPYGVAIATKRMDGIFLYDLPRGGRCRLLRYLRDHSDAILSLSASADGRYLISASADQTAKVWSLAGLRNVNRTFGSEDAWGATFAVENGRLIVKTAIGPGIAVGRDLLVGDVITKVVYAGPTGVVSQTDPHSILEALASVELWETLRLSTLRDGQPRAEDILVTPAWEPVATLFVDENDEWAFWTPQGVYDSSAGGDELFGWHINVARDRDPQFYRAEKFRRELEKPDVMRQLLLSGSLQDALIALAIGPPQPIADVAAAIPTLRLISPQMGTHIGAGETITVQAAVTWPPGTKPENFRVRMFVNQIPGGAPQVRQVNNEFLYSWTAAPAGEQNQIRVVVDEASGAVDALFQDATVQVTADMPPASETEMAMHIFALSAEHYHGSMALKHCNNDAVGMVDLIRQHQGKRYTVGEVELLTDEDDRKSVQRPAVEEKIAAFRQRMTRVAPEDFLVVFVAGHGQAYGKDYFFVPPHERLAEERPRRSSAMSASRGMC